MTTNTAINAFEAESQVVMLQSHALIFTFFGKITTVIIVTPSKNARTMGFGGAARCHPNDTYSREAGMRQAMRKACGIDQGYACLMRELFDSFRDWQRANGYEAGTAQPIKVGDTVEAVTSAPDGLIKGECYRVKQVTERAPYPYHLGGGLWVSADDIRLVREHEAKL